VHPAKQGKQQLSCKISTSTQSLMVSGIQKTTQIDQNKILKANHHKL
jgi:hypothetical protein